MTSQTVVQGRVLDQRGTVLTVWSEAGLARVRVEGSVSCKPGDLVQMVGAQIVEHRPYPGTDFPRPDSDCARFLNTTRWDVLRQRANLRLRLHQWFREQGFLEVETPLLVRSPGTEVHLDPVAARLRPWPGAAPQTRWLITSPEHHMKRLLAAGAPPIYQLARVFRDGERGQNHRPEFTMLEWYRPWCGYEALMADLEDLLPHLASGPTLTWQGRRVDLRPPWPRTTFYSALETYAGVREPARLTCDEQLRALVEHVEPRLGHGRPEFLVDYPLAMASLARAKPANPDFAERFELYVEGIELANAFGELTDAVEQRARCVEDNNARRSLGRPSMPLDEAFLGALECGVPPSAGIALGVDRLLMILIDVAAIDEVLAF